VSSTRNSRTPGAFKTAKEAEDVLLRAKTVVLITSGIHSTEVGGHLTPAMLAYRLATDTSLATRAILDNVILWLVPSLNPDGVSIVTRWYNRTLGTTAEGTDPPELYHHYTGHDNNRDWYAFTQVETQLVVDSIHNVWHPQIVHDIHQQDTDGSRLFLPPYLDPIEPNVDPLLVDGVNALGTAMAWALAGQGKRESSSMRCTTRGRLPGLPALPRWRPHSVRSGEREPRVAPRPPPRAARRARPGLQPARALLNFTNPCPAAGGPCATS